MCGFVRFCVSLVLSIIFVSFALLLFDYKCTNQHRSNSWTDNCATNEVLIQQYSQRTLATRHHIHNLFPILISMLFIPPSCLPLSSSLSLSIYCLLNVFAIFFCACKNEGLFSQLRTPMHAWVSKKYEVFNAADEMMNSILIQLHATEFSLHLKFSSRCFSSVVWSPNQL